MVSAVGSSLLLSLLLLLRPAPLPGLSVSLPAAFLEDLGGSGDAEGLSPSSPSLPPPRTPALSPTSVGPQPTALEGPAHPTNFLDGIVDFFHQYKHKATAYYPSSFPKKKYVDQSDRAGGPRVFSEVPDRAPDSRPEEALDSSQQLQADILAATQNLKSPARAALGSSGEGAQLVEGRVEEGVQGSQEDASEAQACGVPEEKPEVLEESCSAVAKEAPTASKGHEEPEGSFSSTQEAQGPAGPLENPCACSSVSPGV
ncbi:Transmembrane protein 119 [Heterocephalus glaber]|uniref:Transmembrane protein 119 n=1 Tax=Heterocephalus glaber TaxID=10181 RepID=G5AWZ6_HETGA|nr:Transmembrane protein 119 [Heterocephalus glaber]